MVGRNAAFGFRLSVAAAAEIYHSPVLMIALREDDRTEGSGAWEGTSGKPLTATSLATPTDRGKRRIVRKNPLKCGCLHGA